MADGGDQPSDGGAGQDAGPPEWKACLDHILGQELKLGEETETVIRCWAHSMDGTMPGEKVHAFLDTIGLSLNDGRRLLVIDTPALDELMRTIPLDDHWWRVLCEMPAELYQLQTLSWREGNPLAIDIDIDLYLRGGHYKADEPAPFPCATEIYARERKAEAEAPKNIMDVNVLAAAAAASMAYGTHENDGTTLPRMEFSWLTESPPIAPCAEEAAAYARKHADAKPETLALHLSRAGRCPKPAPADSREAVAWTVFCTALAALDRLDAAKKAAAQQPGRPAGARLEDLTYAPPDERPLTDIGRRAQAQLARKGTAKT